MFSSSLLCNPTTTYHDVQVKKRGNSLMDAKGLHKQAAKDLVQSPTGEISPDSHVIFQISVHLEKMIDGEEAYIGWLKIIYVCVCTWI